MDKENTNQDFTGEAENLDHDEMKYDSTKRNRFLVVLGVIVLVAVTPVTMLAVMKKASRAKRRKRLKAF